MNYVVLGTCGEYSNRTVWPSCIVPSEAAAQEIVRIFQRDTRALLMAWKETGHDDQFDRVQFERLLKLMPDPAILAWPEGDISNRDHALQYIRADEWSCY
jgi:hypothetical protein